MLKEFQRQGFTVVRGLLSKQDLLPLKKSIFDVFSLVGSPVSPQEAERFELSALDPFLLQLFETNRAQFVGCATQVQHLIETHRLGLHEKIVNVLKDLDLEFPCISTRPVLAFHNRALATNGNEKYWKTPAHQDWRSIQGSLNSVVVWFPLVPIAENMGRLEVIPKTHLLGLLETEKDDWYRRITDTRLDENNFESISLEVGDVLFFSTFLIHRSGFNSSESVRYSLQFRFNDLAETTFIERGLPNPYMYEPVQQLLTPEFPTPELLIKFFGAQ